jgi:hypothetical protein
VAEPRGAPERRGASGGAAAAPGSRLRTRVILFVLLLVVLGLPAAIGTSWLRSDVPGAVTSGAQPGGRARGRVVDGEGRPLVGRAVEALLVLGAGETRPGPRTESDARGEFALELPAVQGHYLLRAGGEEEQRAVRPLSFLDPHGRAVEPRAVELALRPGAILELAILLPDGRPAAGGHWVLDGTFGEGLLLGCVPYGLRQEGAVVEGRVRADGLPPLRGTLSVVLDTGESLELDVELRPGLNARTVSL